MRTGSQSAQYGPTMHSTDALNTVRMQFTQYGCTLHSTDSQLCSVSLCDVLDMVHFVCSLVVLSTSCFPRLLFKLDK